MENNLKVTVLGVQPYKFNDDKTGREVSGCSVYFIEQKPQNDDFGVGYLPKKASLPYEAYGFLKTFQFPQEAEPVMETSFTSKGARIKITDFKPLKKADLK